MPDKPLLKTIQSPRLNLVSATKFLIRKDIEGRAGLSEALGVEVPSSWPPDLYGPRAMQFALNELGGAAELGWSFWYVITREEPVELAGICGFKGWPDEAGSVEIGYSILGSHQRKGFATEAVQRLTAWAFSHHNVLEVCAETLPHLSQSIGVLEKSGFHYTGKGSETGVIRYAIKRGQFLS
jgi:RimJ/RimL family protein N-acetyltransferase